MQLLTIDEVWINVQRGYAIGICGWVNMYESEWHFVYPKIIDER